MNIQNNFKLLQFDDYSATPKYLQLANALIRSIQGGYIKQDELLPSINDLSYEFEISRDTAERCYKHLKHLGVLESIPGKGYFIRKSDVDMELKIFLLFNKLSVHKKIIYDSFVKALGGNAVIDFYIYNNDFPLFKKLLTGNKRDYTYYVIIPHFLEGGDNAYEIINTIPKEKLLIMDKLLPAISGDYAAIFEDFEKDIYNALKEALKRLRKYHCIKLIFPEYTYHPKEIIQGFYQFCQDYAFEYDVIKEPENMIINKGTAYISLMEDDLVTLIKKILEKKLKVGDDVGVISYNETPMKQIILNGITTISSDFVMLGQKAATMILEKSKEHISVPFLLTLRDSL